MATTASRDRGRLLRAATIGAVAAVFVLPLVFLLSGSLRPLGLPPPSGVEWLPERPTIESYRFVFQLVPLGKQIVNSLIVVSIAVPTTILIASWAGFAIVRGRPRFGRRLVLLSVVALMIPPVALWVPRFILFRNLNVTGTLWPLIAPALMATTPFFVLLFAAWYARLPRSIFEAAELDSATPWQTWRRIALPLSRPAVAAVGVLAFVSHWSNFTDALLYLTRAEIHTVPLGLRALQTLEPTNFPLLLAAAVVATIPPILVFVAAQRSLFKEVVG